MDSKNRYLRQISLEGMSAKKQQKLKDARVAVVGVGGLGAASLPYLAGAGVGHFTIFDHDTVSLNNLHRQTIYKESQIGQPKALLAAAYIKELNSEIDVIAVSEKIGSKMNLKGFDLILDGSDNFETKRCANRLSIESKMPLITASVDQFAGQVAILGGYLEDEPCYECLFPELPLQARNCSDAGILGTVAGLAGLYQAHLALCFLLGLNDIGFGDVLICDYKSLRVQRLKVEKNKNCDVCGNQSAKKEKPEMNDDRIEIIAPAQLTGPDVIVVDVRTDEEIVADPIPGALHMEIRTIPQRYKELPKDKRLAFACASNIRSAQAAAFVQAMGYTDVCIYDRIKR